MKKLVCMILVFSLFLMTSISVGAAVTDTAVTGKTVLQYEDWMLEEIEQGTRWELDQYVGSDETVYVPRFYNKMLIVALGDHCFMNNTSVKSVITSSPLWRIGEYAFIDCTALESIELNFALDTIGSGAFSGTSALKNINLQDSVVTEIKPYTFLNSGIEEVALPETCTKIGNYAFGQCRSLAKITIPASVTEIHQDAFKGSDNVVIYCYTDSYAHQFAVAKGIKYVLLDDTEYEDHYRTSVSLHEFIGVNFYMSLSNAILADPNARMHFSVATKNGDVVSEMPVSESKPTELEKDGVQKTFYKFTCYVCAPEMTDFITYQILTDNQQQGKEYTITVQEYTDKLLAEPERFSVELPLVKAMLNYGAYSQRYFFTDPGTLANSHLSEADQALADVDVDALYSEYNDRFVNNAIGFNYIGATLSLRSETTLSLYFNRNDYLEFSCRHDNAGTIEDMQVETEHTGQYTIVRIPGIKPVYLGDDFVVSVTDRSTNETGYVTYCPMLYCATVMKNNNSDAYKNVCKALYWYYQKAFEYFSL